MLDPKQMDFSKSSVSPPNCLNYLTGAVVNSVGSSQNSKLLLPGSTRSHQMFSFHPWLCTCAHMQISSHLSNLRMYAGHQECSVVMLLGDDNVQPSWAPPAGNSPWAQPSATLSWCILIADAWLELIGTAICCFQMKYFCVSLHSLCNALCSVFFCKTFQLPGVRWHLAINP